MSTWHAESGTPAFLAGFDEDEESRNHESPVSSTPSKLSTTRLPSSSAVAPSRGLGLPLADRIVRSPCAISIRSSPPQFVDAIGQKHRRTGGYTLYQCRQLRSVGRSELNGRSLRGWQGPTALYPCNLLFLRFARLRLVTDKAAPLKRHDSEHGEWQRVAAAGHTVWSPLTISTNRYRRQGTQVPIKRSLLSRLARRCSWVWRYPSRARESGSAWRRIRRTHSPRCGL